MLIFWTFIITWLLWICIKHHSESKSFPPGYARYPFIGSLVSVTGIGTQIVMNSLKYWHKYGTDKLLGIFIGPYLRMVIIKDFQLAREMCSLEVFNGRSSNWKRIVRNKGVIYSENDVWKHNRRSSLKALKDLGFGQSRMSYIIEDEAQDIITTLAGHHGQDVRVHNFFNVNVLNVIWRLVANKRFQRGDKQVDGIIELIQLTLEQPSHPFLLRFSNLFGRSQAKVIKQYRLTLGNFLQSAVDEHLEALDQKEDSQDFITAYLKEMQLNPDLTKDNLIQLLFDFFEAGSETTSTSMAWVLMYLALYSEVQDKCVQELNRVLGDAQVTYEHKKSLPFIEATILEFLRMSSIAYSSLMHVAKQDTSLEGYKIPKGTMMFFSPYKFHMDPAVWGDPEMMRPERFLNKEGTAVIKRDHFIPFGMGKRSCLGESLAKMELFFFTVHILRKLKISLPKHHEVPDKESAGLGLSRYPKPFHVHIEKRN